MSARRDAKVFVVRDKWFDRLLLFDKGLDDVPREQAEPVYKGRVGDGHGRFEVYLLSPGDCGG